MSKRIALLGAGRIGQVHAHAISRTPGAELTAVADAFPDAAQAVAEKYGCEIREIDAIAVAGDIDAVIICTPTDTHADLIEQFARAGKAIFCEKPVDLSIERVMVCLKVVEETGSQMMIGFNRRFDPHFIAVHDAISQGRIGAIEQITITSRDPGLPPKSYVAVSGGIFRDMTIHDFDMARFLLGEEIDTVFATASALVDPSVRDLGDYDTASVTMTTPTGKQVVILNSRRASYGYDQRIEVHGSDGMVQAENQRPADILIANSAGFSQPPLHDFFMTRYTAAYEAEISHFLSALQAGTPLSPSGKDGLESLRLAEAALRSVAQGRTVALDEI
ncbi:MAG: inositol 2-dehydrogenase [Paracoccaceae bacterium]